MSSLAPQRPQKAKRGRIAYPSPKQSIDILKGLSLYGTLGTNCVWLQATSHSDMLAVERCGMGAFVECHKSETHLPISKELRTVDDTAAEPVCNRPQHEAPVRTLRLELEEAFFLQWVLVCLKVYAADLSAPQQTSKKTGRGSTMRTRTFAMIRGIHPPEVEDTEQQPSKRPRHTSPPPSTNITPSDSEHQAHDRDCRSCMSIDDFWGHCIRVRKNWHVDYAAYHQFRSKGWVVRNGFQYGSHFVLYTGHPATVHAQYMVRVILDGTPPITEPDDYDPCSSRQGVENRIDELVMGHDGTLRCGRVGEQASGYGGHAEIESLEWAQAMAFTRVAATVRKQALLLFVSVPAGTNVDSTACLDNIQVEERHLSRWLPNLDREFH